MDTAANKLLEYLDLIPNGHEDMSRYQMKAHNGILTLTGILNTPQKSIATLHFSNEGMTADWHSHPENETVIKISGAKFCIEVEGYGEIEITEEKSFCVSSGIPHRLSYTGGEIHGLAILVPGSNTFPKGVADD